MITFSIIIAAVFAIGALTCYTSCCAAANADKQSEEYFCLKIQENIQKSKSENLKD